MAGLFISDRADRRPQRGLSYLFRVVVGLKVGSKARINLHTFLPSPLFVALSYDNFCPIGAKLTYRFSRVTMTTAQDEDEHT